MAGCAIAGLLTRALIAMYGDLPVVLIYTRIHGILTHVQTVHCQEQAVGLPSHSFQTTCTVNSSTIDVLCKHALCAAQFAVLTSAALFTRVRGGALVRVEAHQVAHKAAPPVAIVLHCSRHHRSRARRTPAAACASLSADRQRAPRCASPPPRIVIRHRCLDQERELGVSALSSPSCLSHCPRGAGTCTTAPAPRHTARRSSATLARRPPRLCRRRASARRRALWASCPISARTGCR